MTLIHSTLSGHEGQCTDLPTRVMLNPDLSFAARGLFAEIMSRESVTIGALGRRDQIGRLLRELALAGITDHLSRIKTRGTLMDPMAARAKVIGEAGTKTCRWCSDLVHSLHAHHFPISYADGGTETVDICGTCHADFHHFTGK